MRILVTSPYPLWPESSGGARRTLGIVRALGVLGHEVSLLSYGEAPVLGAATGIACVRSCPKMGRVGHFFNPRFARELELLLGRGQDLVLAAFPYQALMLVHACRRHGVALIYDAHNHEADRFARLGNPLLAGLVTMVERYMATQAQCVLAVCADDQRALREQYRCAVSLLPNGVDIEAFTPGRADPDLLQLLGLKGKRVVLFCGSFDYRPNCEALALLLGMDWPIRVPGLADAHLLLVGRDVPDVFGDQPGVVFAGEVSDVVPYLRLAHLVLAPLSSGGGTRLKIIEALACGQQVLSTPFGAAGLSGRPIPGLSLCEQALFPQQLQTKLEVQIEPGGNDAGHRWARSLSWQTLAAGVDWPRLAGVSR